MPHYNTFTYGDTNFGGVGGGFSSGTGSPTNPIDLGEATVKPKKSGFDLLGILTGASGLITSVGNLFPATRTTQYVLPPGATAGDNQPQKDNTILYILGAAALVIVALVVMKKK